MNENTDKIVYEVGKQYGSFFVVSELPPKLFTRKNGNVCKVRKLLCRCVCGKESERFISSLSKTVSDVCLCGYKLNGKSGKYPRLYSMWRKKLEQGKLPDEWNDFEIFVDDVEESWNAIVNREGRDTFVMSQTNPSLPLSKTNLTWVETSKHHTKYPYKGGEYSCTELANKFGLSRSLVHNRLKNGDSVEDAIREPEMRGRQESSVV